MIQPTQIDIDRDKGNFRYETDYQYDAGVGLREEVVQYISEVKGEIDNKPFSPNPGPKLVSKRPIF